MRHNEPGDSVQAPDYPGAGPEEPEVRAKMAQELDKLLTLEANWDSYGGAPPSRASIAAAHKLLETVERRFRGAVGDRACPYDVAPIPRGGVQIEWRGDELHLEVEVGPDGDLSYLLKKLRPTGREYEEAHNVSWPTLLPRVQQVLFS